MKKSNKINRSSEGAARIEFCVALVLTVAMFCACRSFSQTAAVAKPGAAATSGLRINEVSTPSLNTAAPTIESTNKSTSDPNVVPDGVKTLEDYQSPYSRPQEGPRSVSIWRVLLSMVFVIMLIFGVIYLLRITMAKGLRYDLKGRHIKVLDMVHLGTNRSLYLIAVGKKVMLLGSSDKGLGLLSEIGGGQAGVEEILESWSEEGGVSFQKEIEEAVKSTETQGGYDQTMPAGIFLKKLKEKLNKLGENKRQ